MPPATDPVDLQPIHERLVNAEQTIADLRERLARAEAQAQEAIRHNPASEEALRLATDAHNLATELQKSLRKLQKEGADVPVKIQEIAPAPAPQDPPTPPDPPETPPLHEHRKPFWHRLL
jgi:uncharacterized membrane protein YccC